MTSGQRPPGTEQLVEQLVLGADESSTLQRVVDLAVAGVAACEWSGVTVVRGGRSRCERASHPVAEQAERLQHEVGEGPCLDAARRDGGLVVVDDLATETRWPGWASVAAGLGVGSVLSLHLATGPRLVGSLNLYAPHAHAFRAADVEAAQGVAAHAAAALSMAQRVAGLEIALESRQVIGAAQGVLRARHGVTLEEAFEVLARLSRDNNLKLRDLAARVVELRRIPPGFADKSLR